MLSTLVKPEQISLAGVQLHTVSPYPRCDVINAAGSRKQPMVYRNRRTYTCVSSAYRWGQKPCCSTREVRPAVYKTKRIGPSTEPWGTPHMMTLYLYTYANAHSIDLLQLWFNVYNTSAIQRLTCDVPSTIIKRHLFDVEKATLQQRCIFWGRRRDINTTTQQRLIDVLCPLGN